MTPTGQDIEEVLLKKIKVIGEQEHSYYGYPAELIGLLADYITADRKRVALEARIDELNNVRSIWTKPGIGDIKFGHWLHYRQKTLVDLAELKAQQEEVK